MVLTEYEDEKYNGHCAILENFASAVLHGTPLLAPGHEAINELQLSNAAYLSQWQGNAEITLPLNCEAFDLELQKRAETSIYREGARIETPTGAYSERWKTQW